MTWRAEPALRLIPHVSQFLLSNAKGWRSSGSPGGAQCAPYKNSALIVEKGEGGGKFDQGSDDDKPAADDRQQEQGVDDDAVPGRALEASPEPF